MRIIDLYAGAGGLSLGFKRVFDGYHCAVEMNAQAAKTWRRNFHDEMRVGRVGDFLDDLPQADLVIGGPPCQGFSVLNIASVRAGGDERNEEWRVFLEAVERSGARAFVIENVPQIRTGGEWFKIKAAGEALGFGMFGHILRAADFGAPTMRRRFIIVGLANGAIWKPPQPTHAENVADMFSDLKPWVTLRRAFADLPDPFPREPKPDETIPDPLHFDHSTDEDKARWAALPPDVKPPFFLWFKKHRPDLIPEWRSHRVDFPNTYGASEWDRPGGTVAGNFLDNFTGRTGHPSRTRNMTLREAARIQSFPDSFEFTGGKRSIIKQIGNAVPPKLAEAVARSLREQMT